MRLTVEIEKTIGSFHLQSRFEAGRETLAILGASGCGKSMTLKCIAGIITPDRGKIELDGTVLFDSKRKINLPPQKRGTGYLFQSHALFPNMTVEQNIACGIPGPRKNKKELIRRKIEDFYLQGLEKHYPSQLSGGQQQRVALARILASEPRLLMLDEPFTGVDSFLKWKLEQEILGVRDEFAGPILFVSHSRDEVYRLCDRISVMEDGSMQPVSGKHDIFEDPQTLSATQLTGCKNISSAAKTGPDSLFARDWNVTLHSAKPVPDELKYVGFRAHYFEITRDAADENALEADITRVIEDIFSIIVILRVRGVAKPSENSFLRLEIEKQSWAALKSPRKLFLKMPPDKLILMK